MRFLLSVAVWFLTLPVIAQSSYRLSDKRADGTLLFPYRWEEVKAPTVPIIQQATPSVGIVMNEWVLAPAGTYEVRNALVDDNEKVGAWSQPRTLAMKDGWALWGAPNNLPHDARASGVAWSVRKLPDGQPITYVDAFNVGGPHTWRSTYPNAPLTSPRLSALARSNGAILTRPGGVHAAVAPPPKVIAQSVPNVPLQAAYAFATHNGETALSPVADMPAAPNYGEAVCTSRALGLGGAQKFPHGALGYHLYVRRVGGDWHRQPSRQCASPTPNDYLQQPDANRMTLFTFREDTPGPQPCVAVGPTNSTLPQSYLDPLSVALKYTNAEIVIDQSVVAYCPIVDEDSGIAGPADDPAGSAMLVGSIPVGPVINKFDPNRSIRATTATVSSGSMAPGCNHATYFPAVLVQGRSSWSGITFNCKVDAGGFVQLYPRSAGIAFRDYSGGQSFNCFFTKCIFLCLSDDPSNATEGVRVLDECAGINGHTASELEFNSCKFIASTPIWLENSQTANVQFTGATHALNWTADSRCPVIWINMPTPVTFQTLYTQSIGGTILSLGWGANVSIGKIFVDQPFRSLIDVNHFSPGQVTLTDSGSHVNFWATNGLPCALFRVVNSTTPFTLTLKGFEAQMSGTGVAATSCAPNCAAVILERSNILTILKLREPSKQQWTALCGLFGWDQVPAEPGYSVDVPNQVVRIPAIRTLRGDTVPSYSIGIPSYTIIANDLTGKPSKVTRVPWE